VNKRIQLLNRLANIRDFLRDANAGVIPQRLVEDFNRLAKNLGADEDWCVSRLESLSHGQ
jgi:hypothetical protein